MTAAELRATNPERYAALRARKRLYRHFRYWTDDEYREAHLAWHRWKYATDEAYRERAIERTRERARLNKMRRRCRLPRRLLATPQQP